MDHGFELTERAVVRFAAALQQVLGRSWATGRLSKTRFCAVTNSGDGAMALADWRIARSRCRFSAVR